MVLVLELTSTRLCAHIGSSHATSTALSIALLGLAVGASVRLRFVATGLGAAFLCVELALIQRFTLAAGGTLYAVSFVLFSLLAWSAAGVLLLGGRWRRLDRGASWRAWRDAGRLLLIAAILAPAGLAIGGPFPVLLARHGEPASRIASLWAINGAASVAGGIVAVLALRVAGSTHASCSLPDCTWRRRRWRPLQTGRPSHDNLAVMAARGPRRSFAQPFVITVGAASLVACGGSSKPPELIANPPSVTGARHAASWKVETAAPGQCTVAPCTADGAECRSEDAKPYPCILDRKSAVIIRHEGETECAYNSALPVDTSCPPNTNCNPPPPEWKPVTVGCPDAP